MRLASVSTYTLGLLALLGCTGPTTASGPHSPAPVVRAQAGSSLTAQADAKAAIDALERGEFEQAGRAADAVLAADADNPYGRLVRAVVRYKKTMHQFALDGRTLVFAGATGGLNPRYLQFAVGQAEADLAGVDADLAVAETSADLSLELCLACWEVDWNGNGRADRGDRMLLQIEQDANGEEIPKGDPRRTPTFRFDTGDVTWARAFVAFQRAAMDFVLAYDWSEVPYAIERMDHGERMDRGRAGRIVIPLRHPERMAAARSLLLEGLDRSDACRRAYLSERDDDREWVPNPRQRSHPLPLPVDDKLYATWEGVVQDLRKLAIGEEVLCMADIGPMIDDDVPPLHGCVDVGGILSRPRDIEIDLDALERFEKKDDVDGMLSSVLGTHYVRKGKPSGLPHRLHRMHQEMERGEESFERKLRYLFWLN